MKFTHISLDPNGVYIGRTANGWLWRYYAPAKSWLTIWTGEEDEPDVILPS